MGSLHPILFEKESQNREWTKEENKKFENALAIHNENSPDRWLKIAALFPGRTAVDVVKKYKALEEDIFNIESGEVPSPGYHALESVNTRNFDGYRKKPLAARGNENGKNKGVLVKEEEKK